METYRLNEHDASITCGLCNTTSRSPNDYRERYCGNCHVFHEDYIHGGEQLFVVQPRPIFSAEGRLLL